MSDLAIRVEKLGKRYRIGVRQRQANTLLEALEDLIVSPLEYLRSTLRRPSEEEILWALKEISFEIQQGEVVGIIGRNGAGKSTLLKILSRITEPTTGRAEIYGRVGSLLEVGIGFHPNLTGRENIYLNGIILGMKKAEIARKFDEIVAFAEIDKFIDTPVKHYSSGMYVRLAFAVAAHLEPEILIVDEVLAVGDTAFQRKCLGKIGDIVKGGRTVLFVSHNMAAIENLCRKILFLDSGKLILEGDPRKVINHYLQAVSLAATNGVPLGDRKDRSGNGRIRLTSFHIEDVSANKLAAVRSGMDVVFVFGFQCPNGGNPKNVDIGFAVGPNPDETYFRLYRSYNDQIFENVPHCGAFRCRIPKFPLSPGRYLVSARVTVGAEEADWPRSGVGFLDVEAGDFYGTSKAADNDTPFLVSGRWEVQQA